MANNFESNFTRKLMMKVAENVEATRTSTKKVDTQTFSGAFNPNSGDVVDIKRPTDYTTTRSATGDLTGAIKDIKTGKASATVQDYISVVVDYDEADEALNMGTDKDRFFDDIARRIVIDHELDFNKFQMANAGLKVGTTGQGVDSWAEIAEAGALMQSIGVPMSKKWCYALNPYSQVALANEQRSLGVNPEVKTALSRATVAEDYAGFSVITSTTLPSYTTSGGADRAGAVNGTMNVTYTAAKDSMKLALAVDGFNAGLTVKAGETITIAGVNMLNQATRELATDATGAAIPWVGTVTEEASLNGSGAGTLVVTGAPIYEASGAFNTVDSAIADGAVVTLSGSGNTVYKPNLFWHPDAFSIAYVDIKKLKSTDTIYKSNDGLVMRCSMDSDVITNKQIVRFDLRPAYAVINPFFAGQGFGKA